MLSRLLSSIGRKEQRRFGFAALRKAHESAWSVSDPIGPQGAIVAVKRGGLLPSDIGLEAIVAATEKHGVAVTPEGAGFSEIVATTKAYRLDGGLSCLPESWAAAAFGKTPGDYIARVHSLAPSIAQIFDEQLREVIRSRRYPESFVFEFANVCNLACPICPRHHRSIADGLMSVDHAKRLLNDIADVNEEVTLYPHYLGETLIHPDFLQLIDHASSFPNLRINIISNGVLLTDEMIEELLRRPLRNFHFSLHECDTALQEGIHPRNALSSRNVLKFLQRAVTLGRRSDIWVGVSLVPMELFEPAVESFRSFWQDVVDGVNIYSFQRPNRTSSDSSIEKAFTGINLPCTSPWLQPVIAVDGSVLPCCWDYQHQMVLGNVFEKGFADIYAGKEALALRDALLKGELDGYPVCKSCRKWIEYLPSFRAVEMEGYWFSSNGTFLSFATISLQSELIETKLAEILIEGSGRQNLPVHRKARPQAHKHFGSRIT